MSKFPRGKPYIWNHFKNYENIKFWGVKPAKKICCRFGKLALFIFFLCDYKLHCSSPPPPLKSFNVLQLHPEHLVPSPTSAGATFLLTLFPLHYL